MSAFWADRLKFSNKTIKKVKKDVKKPRIVSKKEFFDYEAKYLGASEEITPARISADVTKVIFAQSEKIYDYL